MADAPGGRVRVATELARDDAGEPARGAPGQVSDNGPGFADKVLKRAFEPYVTTKSQGHRARAGGGASKIADEHGARIRIGNLEPPRGRAPG